MWSGQMRTRSLVSMALLVAISAPAVAEIPMEISASGHATVPVSGSFGMRQFVFDTGAEGSAVYADFVRKAGLSKSGSMTLQGQTGSSEVPMVALGELTVDGNRNGPIEAVMLPDRVDGVPLAGIIGLDVFGDRLVDFDLPRRRVSLLPPTSRLKGFGVAVKGTKTIGNLLTIPVKIGTVGAIAVIDTGARKTRINWALGRLLGFRPEQLERGDTIQGATNRAVETGAARVDSVRLGGVRIGPSPVLVADLPVFEAFGVADRPAVILGLDWLEKTRMLIDFPSSLVWFQEPS